MSEPQTLARAILTRRAPGSGSGTGYSRISNGVPVPWKTASWALSGMGALSLVAFPDEREGAGDVRGGDRSGRAKIGLVEGGEAGDAEQAETDAHLVLQQLEHTHEAGGAGGGEPAARQPPEAHHLRTERHRLHDVAAARIAAVNEDSGPARHRRHHLGEHLGAAGAVVELATAVIGDVDAIHPVLDREAGVLRGGDALQDEGDRVPVLEPLHLVPGQRFKRSEEHTS